MIEDLPECELGNIDENNRKIYAKFGYDALKVRPCETYLEVYNECKTLITKFHHLYVSGIRPDCKQWYNDYTNCMKFRKNKKIEHFEEVLNSEKKRVEIRLKESQKNDVWKYRTKPPKDFVVIDLEQVPKSDVYSPFAVYESIKEKRRNRPLKEEEKGII